MTGSGRLNAASLTDELHRLYRPSERFGYIHPLIYSLCTCPRCYFSTFYDDFAKPKQKVVQSLQTQLAKNSRSENIKQIFGSVDFFAYRSLKEGIASYLAAIYSYEHFPANQAPVLKQGICAIRAAWLSCHLSQEQPHENYDYLARILYRKAAFFYNQAILLNDTAEQALVSFAITNYGPDTDHNFGLDGAIYLASMLRYKYGQRSDRQLRLKHLKEAKIMISRLVGTGKVSGSKPSAILNIGRRLYEEISEEVEKLGA